jgi:hypothetical protein
MMIELEMIADNVLVNNSGWVSSEAYTVKFFFFLQTSFCSIHVR